MAAITVTNATVASQGTAISSMDTKIVAAVSSTGSDNLIYNGNFEQDLAAWENWGTLAVRRVDKRTTGVYHLFLNSTDTTSF